VASSDWANENQPQNSTKAKSHNNRNKRGKREEIEDTQFPACEERKWNDGKGRKTVKGAFSEREVVVLRGGIWDYARENGLSSKDLEDLINESAKEKGYSRAWVEISKVLRKLICEFEIV